MPDLFFSYGRIFNSLEKLLEFENKWPDMQVDLDEFKKFMYTKISEIETNLQTRGSMTNLEAYQLLRSHTNWIEDLKKTNDE